MRLKLLTILLVGVFFFIFATQKISAEEEIQEVRLSVTDDTYVSQSSPDSINGNKTFLSAKAQQQDNNLGLLKFSTSKVPKGSIIGSATLLMTSSSCIGADPTPNLELYESIDDWNEETARWNGKPRLGQSLGIINAAPEVKSWNVTNVVNSWVQETDDNFGLILTVSGGPYWCSFYSKEKTNDSINLVVRFIPPDSTKPVISQVKTAEVTFTGATITWNTDEDSSSYVDYYTTSSSDNMFFPDVKSIGQNNNTKFHTVTLNNLSSGKKYNFRVRSKDIVGNQGVSNYTSFTTKSLLLPNFGSVISPITINTLAPTNASQEESGQEGETTSEGEESTSSSLEISGIKISQVTDTSARITWKTNEEGNSWIYYSSNEAGAQDSPEFESVSSNEEVTDHEITLKGLTPNTIYDYYVASKNSAGEGEASETYSFTTLEKGASKKAIEESSENTEKNMASESAFKRIGDYIAGVNISQSNIIIALLVIILLLVAILIMVLLKRRPPTNSIKESVGEETGEKEVSEIPHKNKKHTSK